MPTLVIDDQKVTVDPGTTIIQAAKKLDITIPHYCYHPRLKSVDMCRMCLVEVKDIPKLQTACSTQVRDNMVVFTNNQKVLDARRSVLEFLLINHPLDCPICDKAGECMLQDFYFQFSLHTSKFKEKKQKKHKVVNLGPKIVLDSERCILCARCVRFLKEVVGTEELGIFDRGDHSEIGIYPGRPLENNYQGNLADVCPVGALTAKDFRFACRSWFLCQENSICPGCSTGCNVLVHSSERSYDKTLRRVYRLTPRDNDEVNQSWLCDVGRYGYHFVDDPDRLTAPSLKRGEEYVKVDWDTAFREVAQRLRGIFERYSPSSLGIIPSPQLTNEDLYMVKKFFNETLCITNIDFKLPGWNQGQGDGFLLKADRNPNTMGAELLGLSGIGPQAGEIIEKTRLGEIKALYLVGSDPARYLGEEKIASALSRAQLVVFQGSNYNYACKFAHAILPSATFVEKEGTFTNAQARVQKINQVLKPLGESLPDWKIILRLALTMGYCFPYKTSEDIFKDIAREVTSFSGLDYKKVGDKGIKLALSGG